MIFLSRQQATMGTQLSGFEPEIYIFLSPHIRTVRKCRLFHFVCLEHCLSENVRSKNCYREI